MRVSLPDGTQLYYIVTDQAGTARELCSEEGDIHWRGEQGLWAHTVNCAIRDSCTMQKRGFTTTGIVTMMQRAGSIYRRTR